ncbi:hypothetical protein EDD15DRAFT_157915 [Pisolithus albus]|nr:hypothetical protein EDD15DRAFT_157915 [Pisolithus albus]
MYAMHSLNHLLSLCFFLSFFSWCLLFQSSITLKFTFSWLLRGQFSISLGSVLQVPLIPLPPTPFRQLLAGGNDFVFSFLFRRVPVASLVLEARVLSPQRQCIYCDFSRAGRSTDLKITTVIYALTTLGAATHGPHFFTCNWYHK